MGRNNKRTKKLPGPKKVTFPKKHIANKLLLFHDRQSDLLSEVEVLNLYFMDFHCNYVIVILNVRPKRVVNASHAVAIIRLKTPNKQRESNSAGSGRINNLVHC